jgi:hypothetical protein
LLLFLLLQLKRTIIRISILLLTTGNGNQNRAISLLKIAMPLWEFPVYALDTAFPCLKIFPQPLFL